MELKKRNILITGGTGFLGSHICDYLHQEHGISSIFTPRSENYDLRYRSEVKSMFADFNADIVIHLAARVGGIGLNQSIPGELFYDNLIMGSHLMEYGRIHEIDKFVGIGTICSYPENTPIPFSEEDFWKGYPEPTNAAYGIAKKMLVAQSRAYKKQYDFKSINLIPVNLYGPRDNFDLKTGHVIPALINRFQTAKEQNRASTTLWGSGRATREFLYVKDAARGIIEATRKHSNYEPINLGSNLEISIRDLAQKIKKMTGYKGQLEWNTDRPDGQKNRKTDTSRAKKNFGFESRISLDEGLRRTIKYFRKNREQIDQNPEETGYGRMNSLPDYIKK